MSAVPLPKKNTDSKAPHDSSSSTLWPTSPAPPRRSSSPTPSSSSNANLQANVDSILDPSSEPLATKCDVLVNPNNPHAREHSERSVCCKDLVGEDERTLVDPDIVRDVIIGLSDGLTVPFALTAGLSGLGNARIVVLGGLAELIAGAISMGIGGFLASQAELDHFHYLRRQTHARVLRSCSGEMEREVHAVLGSVGLEEPLSRLVAQSLLKVEADNATAADWDDNAIHPPSSSWWKFGLGGSNDNKDKKIGGGQGGEEEGGALRWSKDVGVSGFLMRFGEGLEETPYSRLYISALTIGLSYFIGGLCPLLPYVFVSNVQTGLIYSSIVTVFILLLFGLAKTHFTGAAGGFGGYAYGAISTAFVGAAAAGAAFGIVRLLEV